jgi:pyruvate kinase
MERPPVTGAPAFEIIATLGPASMGEATALSAAGATGFRLNASHLEATRLQDAISLVRSVLPRAPLVVDLQGAKMRLGIFPAREVRRGEPVRFSLAPEQGGALPLPHPELFRAVVVGDTLSIDDDRLQFQIQAVSAGRIETAALTQGLIRPRKGVNVLEHPVTLEDLTEGDRALCQALAPLSSLTFAFSFMKDGSEAAWLRRIAPAAGVIGKVERREAMLELPRLAAAVDALWICRGDLGAQLGSTDLARFVAGLDPRALGRPVLMAGQVLEHLTEHAEPTRSEVCHLYDLVARGYAGIVLSDETAIGVDPVRAVRTAASLVASFQG